MSSATISVTSSCSNITMATEEEKETVIFHGVDKRVVMIQI
jgi:hypothetical protein